MGESGGFWNQSELQLLFIIAKINCLKHLLRKKTLSKV